MTIPALPIEEILREPFGEESVLPRGRELGRSREGREIVGHRLGSGPLAVSLLAGCHADEPVGPAMLERLVRFLVAQPEGSPLLRGASWSVVPRANPDGDEANRGWTGRTRPLADHLGAADRGYELARFLEHAVRELPGDDVEFGFPEGDDDAEARPENRAVAEFLAEGAPFALHGTFHGMAFAEGPWFLLEPAWVERTEDLRRALAERVAAMGCRLHDVDRKGEKGFHRIAPGFSTRPDSRAMAAHFIAHGEAETAALFRPSSMEHVRGLGGDPLTLVSEMPLFLMSLPEGNAPAEAPPYPTGTRGRLDFVAWARRVIAAKGREGFEAEAARHGIRPMPIRDQMRLQLELLNQALEAVAC